MQEVLPNYLHIGNWTSIDKPCGIGFDSILLVEEVQNHATGIIYEYWISHLLNEIEEKIINIHVVDLDTKINFPFLRDFSQIKKNIKYLNEIEELRDLDKTLSKKISEYNKKYLNTTYPSVEIYNKNTIFEKLKYDVILLNLNTIKLRKEKFFDFNFLYLLKNEEANNNLGIKFLIYSDKENISEYEFTNLTRIKLKRNTYEINPDLHKLGLLLKYSAFELQNNFEESIIKNLKLIQESNQELVGTDNKDIEIYFGNVGNSRKTITLGKGSQNYHMIISGQSGQGKSNILNHIILELAQNYSPKEIEFSLFDFVGTELVLYEKLVHLDCLFSMSVENQKFDLAILKELSLLEDEMKSRNSEITRKAKDIDEYNLNQGMTIFKKKIIIFDEFQNILIYSDKNKLTEINLKFDHLMRVGRKAGFHFIICSQNLNHFQISGEIIKQAPIRILTRIDGSVNKLLATSNNVELGGLKIGTILLNTSNGLKEGNNFVEIPFSGDTKTILKKIEQINLKNKS